MERCWALLPATVNRFQESSIQHRQECSAISSSDSVVREPNAKNKCPEASFFKRPDMSLIVLIDLSPHNFQYKILAVFRCRSHGWTSIVCQYWCLLASHSNDLGPAVCKKPPVLRRKADLFGKREIMGISFQGQPRCLETFLGTEAKMLNWDTLSQLWTAGKSMNIRLRRLPSRYLFAAPGSSHWSKELTGPKSGLDTTCTGNTRNPPDADRRSQFSLFLERLGLSICNLLGKSKKKHWCDWSCPTQSTASPCDLLHLRPRVHAWPLPGGCAN